MGTRRPLRGKKLLVTAGLAGASYLAGCGDDAVANLMPPPDSSRIDSGADSGADSGRMDSGGGDSGGTDADIFDAAMEDAPVANLLPPPDSGES